MSPPFLVPFPAILAEKVVRGPRAGLHGLVDSMGRFLVLSIRLLSIRRSKPSQISNRRGADGGYHLARSAVRNRPSTMLAYLRNSRFGTSLEPTH
jgi:hypothetical protein